MCGRGLHVAGDVQEGVRQGELECCACIGGGSEVNVAAVEDDDAREDDDGDGKDENDKDGVGDVLDSLNAVFFYCSFVAVALVCVGDWFRWKMTEEKKKQRAAVGNRCDKPVAQGFCGCFCCRSSLVLFLPAAWGFFL